jgi:hypothetical protein
MRKRVKGKYPNQGDLAYDWIIMVDANFNPGSIGPQNALFF